MLLRTDNPQIGRFHLYQAPILPTYISWTYIDIRTLKNGYV